MSLQPLVEELQQLFPFVDPEIIKTALIDCNYDKNACAELLFMAQENGSNEVPTFIDPTVDHHQDVTLVYKDSVVTINRDQMVGDSNPTNKPRANTLNEEYKKAAAEDEEAAEKGIIPSTVMIDTEEKAYEKKQRKHKHQGKRKEKYSLLDSEVRDDGDF
ncbi:hypothetical protein EDI_302370 [Entamoeba dispar SAW760]|uniref:CUE domain-containing protein n=1 Tax=Entamoeba dispar (strain ATCC PRA-260 / SAW760) TaxID=370354 RepID=B0EGS6_ENTDS|nr:uncharacterized protein EDI_302370 [Entamoeba dispar SAW760]EDR26269.1 hypothetical protein EDI_302370 [Entamoeba dispar SAW760]|eukprot:EDR26269.1 hypothetical protein EDI_302370 [Entamoeba dispar SAW760]